MAMNDDIAADARTDERLGCGRPMDGIWDTLDRTPDAHQQHCPYCLDARRSLAELHAATRDLVRRERADPELRASPTLVSTILDIARAEIRRGRRLPLVVNRDDPDAPVLTVSEQAIVSVIWRAGDRLTDVQTRRCTITLQDASETAPLDHPSTVDLTVTASVASGTPIPFVVEALRREIREAVTHEVGMLVGRIDVTVEDLHD